MRKQKLTRTPWIAVAEKVGLEMTSKRLMAQPTFATEKEIPRTTPGSVAVAWPARASTAGWLLLGLSSLSVHAVEPVTDLPLALSNSAVAAVSQDDGFRLYSFLGLQTGKSWRDVSTLAFEYDSQRGSWIELEPVPVAQGRLASVAAVVAGKVYLFGGYTVSEDHEEVSTPEVLQFDPSTRRYQPVAPMPLPVDDSVALVYRERYIILVSGWHTDANVNDVQIYDTVSNRWSSINAYPGTPVFGHAAALHGDHMLVCDGVQLDVSAAGKRVFSASRECWLGRVLDDAEDAAQVSIEWTPAPPHPDSPRYRMGANSDPSSGQLVFAGGSPRPYNYDGTGYDGEPAEASAQVDAFDLESGQWVSRQPLHRAAMDFRGLPCAGERCFLIGGMRAGQIVAADVIELPRSPMVRTEAESADD